MRPQSIIRFEQAYLASVLIWLAHVVLGWSAQVAAIERLPAVSGNPQMVQAGQSALIAANGAGLVLWLLLWFLVARRASAAAKWILVGFLGLSALSLLAIVPSIAQVSGLSLTLTVLAFGLNAYAVRMLFMPDATAWLNGAAAGGVEQVD